MCSATSTATGGLSDRRRAGAFAGGSSRAQRNRKEGRRKIHCLDGGLNIVRRFKRSCVRRPAQRPQQRQSLRRSTTQRAECWRIIDARLWFIQMVSKDYEGELTTLDRELESELSTT